MADRLLVDLGGTTARVGLAGARGVLPETVQTMPNADHPSLAALLATYLTGIQAGHIHALCAGVAGPVRAGTAQLTNHSWLIEAATLAAATGADHVHLINDLQAQAWALDDLAPEALHPLITGTADPDGPRLVLGLGTGCNVAVAHRTAAGLLVPPSESGHTTLPDAPDFRALYDDLRSGHPHLPIEAALSGPGLFNLHRHLTGDTLTPQQIIAAAPPETLQAFTHLLGLVAGNLCLAHMATGGLFLIGGTARAIAPHIGQGFRDSFTARGPYTPILRALPVTLVTDDTAALAGLNRCLASRLAA
ncbi:glucokinase [Roseovarius aestuariivivens]|uniref:glucokinase n=1 Tax=Roseovarius aestuariivivens TaxID=1888910 RepID=UPI00108097EF|nr:glucokinase [Roseovarius aestuariivivens]